MLSNVVRPNADRVVTGDLGVDATISFSPST